MSLYITDENGKLHKIAGAGGGSGIVSNEAIAFAESERQKSKNLLNMEWLIQGAYLFADGTFSALSGYMTTSRKIDVEPNSVITVSSNLTPNADCGFVFFKDNAFVSATPTADTTITVPSNANQVVYNFITKGNSITWAQLEYGDVATEYQEYCGKILHEVDVGASGGSIATNILTAKMIAYYHPSQNGVLEVLPLIEHKRIGSKLSVNSSGGIVIGDGVKTIKASALARSNFGGYKGSMRLDICKNRTWYAGGRNVQNGTVLNIVTLSIEPILIEVNSGDIITLEFRRDDSTAAHVEGYTVPISTYITVEVVE